MSASSSWIDRFDRWVLSIEHAAWGPRQILPVLALTIGIRHLLEIGVARNPVFDPMALFVHYPLAYLAPFVALTLVLAFWGQVSPSRIARLMAIAWLLTLTPPLFDLLAHRSHELPTIGYLHADPADLGYVWSRFLDLRIPLSGTTLGIRLETIAALLMSSVYVWLRTRSWPRIVGVAFCTYLASLFFFTLPVLVQGAYALLGFKLDAAGFWFGTGIVARGDTQSSSSAIAILWLIPVCGVLLQSWRCLERRQPVPQRWLPLNEFGSVRGRRSFADLAAIVTLGSLLAGVFAVRWLWLPLSGTLVRAPFDSLSIIGSGVALLLLATSRSDERFDLLRLSGAISILLALERAAALPLAVAGLSLLALVGSPRRRSERANAALTILGLMIACSAAAIAGWSLVLGPESLARLPAALIGSSILCGAGCGSWLAASQANRRGWGASALAIGLASGAGVSGGWGCALVGLTIAAALAVVVDRLGIDSESALRCRFAATLVALSVALLAYDSFAAPELRDARRPKIACVARLERLKAEEYFRSGKTQDARSSFRQALRCDPQDVGALRGLGLIAAQRDHDPKVAVDFFERALAANPGAIQELSNLAAAYRESGRSADALALIDAHLESAPRDPELLFTRAQTLTDLGRNDQALTAWSRFIELFAGRPAQAEALAQARSERRRLEALKPSGAAAGPR